MPAATQTHPVLDMLREDHERVKNLFGSFERARDAATKRRLIGEALRELEIHAALEEGMIYPAIREQIEEEDLMDEALEEHHLAKVLIRELKRMKPSDERFDAKVSVLGESVKHHIEEEEREILPKAEEAEIDWTAMEDKIVKRRERLMQRRAGGNAGGRRRGRRSTGRRA